MADYPSLQPYVDQIYTCNRTRCGFCSVECPVFRVKRTESYASRGAVSNVLPVDVAVPGCPPSPTRILAGILTAISSRPEVTSG